jgi:dinuclear metal center YbgI/SA1388 family protein
MAMKLSEVLSALDQIAPTRLAEPWDNVGLLVGDPQQDVSRAMLTIDYTADVAAEAREAGCDLIIAYHPPIFEALKRIVAPHPIYDAISRGVAIYSPHTALDVADGGTNDMLADALGLVERRPLRLAQTKASQLKLVTFVPEAQVDTVASALFDAGCGRIGNYTQCSFRSPGQGTFFGDESTNPAVGKKNQLERADEIRLETVVPIACLANALKALYASHPYEEPAFDLVQLAAAPEKSGQGRIGTLAEPTDRADVLRRIKSALERDHLLVAGPTDGKITTAAACAGSCGDLLNDALAQKAELYLTGEMRHHDALKAAGRGMTVVCTLHSNSERAVLKRLSAKLTEALPSLAVQISARDADPFAIR